MKAKVGVKKKKKKGQSWPAQKKQKVRVVKVGKKWCVRKATKSKNPGAASQKSRRSPLNFIKAHVPHSLTHLFFEIKRECGLIAK